MKIATWNINNLKRRLPLLLEWLAEAKPDAVALQETKVTDAEFPHAALEAAGYGSLAAGQRTWNGVALLARDAEPIAVRRSLPGDPADVQARYLEAAIGGVLVASIYLPNGNPQPGPKFAYKMAWFERLIAQPPSCRRAAIRSCWPATTTWCRPRPTSIRRTSYRDNALLQPAPRAAYRTLLAQGWTDAIRAVHPNGPVYTFWDYLRQRWPRDAGLRIDHLLLSKELARRLADAGVDREVRGRDKPATTRRSGSGCARAEGRRSARRSPHLRRQARAPVDLGRQRRRGRAAATASPRRADDQQDAGDRRADAERLEARRDHRDRRQQREADEVRERRCDSRRSP